MNKGHTIVASQCQRLFTTNAHTPTHINSPVHFFFAVADSMLYSVMNESEMITDQNKVQTSAKVNVSRVQSAVQMRNGVVSHTCMCQSGRVLTAVVPRAINCTRYFPTFT